MTEHEPGVRPNDSYVKDGDAARKTTDRTAQGGGKVHAARNVGRTTQSRDESMRERLAFDYMGFNKMYTAVSKDVEGYLTTQ